MSFSESYRFIGQSKEEAIGTVDIWENINDNSLAFGVSLPDNYPVEQLHKRSSWKHPGVFELLAAEIQKSQQIQGKIMVFYEYFTKTLMDEVIRRHQEQEKYPETEIWYFMDQMIEALTFLHENGYSHQNLRPQTIYVASDGSYVIHEQGINPGQRYESNQVAYQPPEVFNLKLNIPISLPKADIFSLGVTLLEMCTLDSPAIIYNKTSRTINIQFLENFLQNIQQNYSPFLVQLIREMIDFQDRPTINDVRKILKPYVNQIRFRQQFFPQSLSASQVERPSENQYQSQQKLNTQNSYQLSQIKFEDQQQQSKQNPQYSRPYDLPQYDQNSQSNNIPFDLSPRKKVDQVVPNNEVQSAIQKSQDILNQLSRN